MAEFNILGQLSQSSEPPFLFPVQFVCNPAGWRAILQSIRNSNAAGEMYTFKCARQASRTSNLVSALPLCNLVSGHDDLFTGGIDPD